MNSCIPPHSLTRIFNTHSFNTQFHKHPNANSFSILDTGILYKEIICCAVYTKHGEPNLSTPDSDNTEKHAPLLTKYNTVYNYIQYIYPRLHFPTDTLTHTQHNTHTLPILILTYSHHILPIDQTSSVRAG